MIQTSKMRHDYYEFRNAIYPISLMVAWGGDKKWSSEDFEDIEFADGNAATTYYCQYKPSGKMCVLIRFYDKRVMSDYGVVSHESFHAAMFILDYVGSGISVDYQEHAAYLAGWVANCINRVRKGDLEPIKLQETHNS